MSEQKTGKLDIGSQADDFIKYFMREKTHVSFFYDAEELRFEIQSEDVVHVEKREVTMSILGTLISKSYNMVEATFTVTPRKEDITKSCVEYTFEFDEKINNCTEETEIVESLLTYILISDGNNTNGDDFRYNSFVAGYPATECFKRYLNEFRDDDDVSLVEVNSRPKRIFTVAFNDAPNLVVHMDDEDESLFQSIEVTITITPMKDDNRRSHVNWTIKVQKSEDREGVSRLFLETADHIRETIILAIKTLE
ncbi:unnamed protein product [Eruca vesicaria subsp. sativa]|uniref:Uncharacterized protein n=1 Tax=Eruca vesicaria subsp. sativa TaxID=29727 RepID=A0ABC8JYN6_ERUVS|nr:unnamed protein product [Eruca vesicaria subsp. sativa]